MTPVGTRSNRSLPVYTHTHTHTHCNVVADMAKRSGEAEAQRAADALSHAHEVAAARAEAEARTTVRWIAGLSCFGLVVDDCQTKFSSRWRQFRFSLSRALSFHALVFRRLLHLRLFPRLSSWSVPTRLRCTPFALRWRSRRATQKQPTGPRQRTK